MSKGKVVLVLTIDSIPPNNWGENLRKYLEPEVWDFVRKEVYKHFGYKCAACGLTDIECHCHEDWEFNDSRHLQTLKGFLCLCPDCHSIKHFPRQLSLHRQRKITNKELLRLKYHFCDVNKVNLSYLNLYLDYINRTQRKYRSSFEYKLDWGKLPPERINSIWKRYKDGKGPKSFQM